MSEKTDASYILDGNEAFLDYLRRYRTAEVCAQFFRHHIKDNSDILDCGCGPGSVTLGLAEWASSGKTIGIDLNGDQFEIARASAEEKGISNIEFQQASIFELPFEDNQFDLVFAQAVFVHIPDHNKAMSEIHRVLKPGGHVALRDIINSLILISPSDPLVDKLRVLFRKGMTASGGDPDIGLSLGQLLLDSNFDDLELSIEWEHSPKHEFRKEYFANHVDVFDNGEFGDLAVNEGWVTEKERKQIGEHCRNLANNPAAIWGLPFVQALARKPLS